MLRKLRTYALQTRGHHSRRIPTTAGAAGLPQHRIRAFIPQIRHVARLRTFKKGDKINSGTILTELSLPPVASWRYRGHWALHGALDHRYPELLPL